jgi:hypothetical protein
MSRIVLSPPTNKTNTATTAQLLVSPSSTAQTITTANALLQSPSSNGMELDLEDDLDGDGDDSDREQDMKSPQTQKSPNGQELERKASNTLSAPLSTSAFVTPTKTGNNLMVSTVPELKREGLAVVKTGFLNKQGGWRGGNKSWSASCFSLRFPLSPLTPSFSFVHVFCMLFTVVPSVELTLTLSLAFFVPEIGRGAISF